MKLTFRALVFTQTIINSPFRVEPPDRRGTSFSLQTKPFTWKSMLSLIRIQFALVTRRPYCPRGPKKLCFTTLSLIPMVSIARLSVVKQSSFGLPGQYGRRVTRVNSNELKKKKGGGGGAPVLCLTHGTAPLSPFLDVCNVTVNYHVTNFTDEDWWFQWKRLLIVKIKMPEKDFKNSSNPSTIHSLIQYTNQLIINLIYLSKNSISIVLYRLIFTYSS